MPADEVINAIPPRWVEFWLSQLVYPINDAVHVLGIQYHSTPCPWRGVEFPARMSATHFGTVFRASSNWLSPSGHSESFETSALDAWRTKKNPGPEGTPRRTREIENPTSIKMYRYR